MTLSLFSLLVPLVASAAVAAPAGKSENLVSCQLKDFSTCTDCEKRIPASCEDHAFGGSLETSLKPKKIQWLVSNPESGSEKIISADNKTLSLKDLKASKDLKATAVKQKVAVGANEKVSLLGVQLAPGSALYKSQSGTEIAAQMKPQTSQRSVASAASPIAGGVKRAQKMNSTVTSKSTSKSKAQK